MPVSFCGMAGCQQLTFHCCLMCLKPICRGHRKQVGWNLLTRREGGGMRVHYGCSDYGPPDECIYATEPPACVGLPPLTYKD
jgi:hypothetical protein